MFHRSERLFLRPVFYEDWEAIHAGIANEATVRNLATAPWPYREQDAKDYVMLERQPHLPNFSVILPGSGLIGQVGMGIDEETSKVQIGYWLSKEYRGHGFATEAAQTVVRIAKLLGHKYLTASHFLDNPASGRVLRKAGFRPTGVIRKGFSLARGGHDPVACYELDLQEDASGGKEDDPNALARVA